MFIFFMLKVNYYNIAEILTENALLLSFLLQNIVFSDYTRENHMEQKLKDEDPNN